MRANVLFICVHSNALALFVRASILFLYQCFIYLCVSVLCFAQVNVLFVCVNVLLLFMSSGSRACRVIFVFVLFPS